MKKCSECGLQARPLLGGMCGGCRWGTRSKQGGHLADKATARKMTFIDSQVRELRRIYQKVRGRRGMIGRWYREQARQHGVSTRTIAAAARGESYRWVKEAP